MFLESGTTYIKLIKTHAHTLTSNADPFNPW